MYVKHLYIVGPLMVLIEIFAKHSWPGFLFTFLILFAGSKKPQHLWRMSSVSL